MDDWAAATGQQTADPWALSAQLAQAQPWMASPPGISNVNAWDGYPPAWAANSQVPPSPPQPPGGMASVQPNIRQLSSLGSKVATPKAPGTTTVFETIKWKEQGSQKSRKSKEKASARKSETYLLHGKTFSLDNFIKMQEKELGKPTTSARRGAQGGLASECEEKAGEVESGNGTRSVSNEVARIAGEVESGNCASNVSNEVEGIATLPKSEQTVETDGGKSRASSSPSSVSSDVRASVGEGGSGTTEDAESSDEEPEVGLVDSSSDEEITGDCEDSDAEIGFTCKKNMSETHFADRFSKFESNEGDVVEFVGWKQDVGHIWRKGKIKGLLPKVLRHRKSLATRKKAEMKTDTEKIKDSMQENKQEFIEPNAQPLSFRSGTFTDEPFMQAISQPDPSFNEDIARQSNLIDEHRKFADSAQEHAGKHARVTQKEGSTAALPSRIEATAIEVMNTFNEMVEAEVRRRVQEAQRIPVTPDGSTASWLSGTDDGSRTGGDNQQDASGTPLQPKPLSTSIPRGTWEIGTLIPRKAGNPISAVQSPDDWVEIEITVDSGACETVMPANLCQAISIFQSSTSHGAEYEVANGATIPNLGERRCLMMTVGSTAAKRIVFQVADVHKPLLSISRCADMGFRCHLGKEGGYMEDTVTGETIPLLRRENLYVMKAWVKQEPATGGVDPGSPFGRPA